MEQAALDRVTPVVPSTPAPEKGLSAPELSVEGEPSAEQGPPKTRFNWIVGGIAPVLFFALWELAARTEWISSRLFPPPTAVAQTILALGQSGELWQHVWTTGYRVVLGFVFGVAAGTVLGALTGYSSVAKRLLDPSLQALRAIPSLAWVPLFILWLGIFETSKVTLIAVGVFFPVYLNLAGAIHNVDRKLVEVGRMYRFSGVELVRYILLPAALPVYVIGLRNGLGLGWMFVVAAELMGASEGLGFLLVDGQMTGRPATIMAAIVLFAIAGKITDGLLAWLSTRLLRWQDSFKPNG
jgi:sulfonate transport system permease protein